MRSAIVAIVVAGACGSAPRPAPPPRPWPVEGRCVNQSYARTPDACIVIDAAGAEAIRRALLDHLATRPAWADAHALAAAPLTDGTIGHYFILAYRHDGRETLLLTGVLDTDGHVEHGYRIRVVRELDGSWRVDAVQPYSDPLPQPNA